MANKTKRAMSPDAKAKVRSTKAAVTKKRKDGRRVPQEAAASLNRATGRKPWDQVKAKRRAIRHGVAGAA